MVSLALLAATELAANATELDLIFLRVKGRYEMTDGGFPLTSAGLSKTRQWRITMTGYVHRAFVSKMKATSSIPVALGPSYRATASSTTTARIFKSAEPDN